MASLTIRNIPEDAKRRFRQRAAARGRSMEEEARQLIVDAATQSTSTVQERRAEYRSRPRQAGAEDDDWVHELIDMAGGVGEGVFDEKPDRRMGMFEYLYRASRPGFDLPEVPDSPASYADFDE